MVNSIDFNDVYLCSDADSAFVMFYDHIFKVYNACFPIKNKVLKSWKVRDPWVTPVLKKCIRKKFYLYNMLKRGLITI